MSLKKLCDRILSYVQNKHISFNLYFKKKKKEKKKEGYCYCVHPYKNLSID